MLISPNVFTQEERENLQKAYNGLRNFTKNKMDLHSEYVAERILERASELGPEIASKAAYVLLESSWTIQPAQYVKDRAMTNARRHETDFATYASRYPGTTAVLGNDKMICVCWGSPHTPKDTRWTDSPCIAERWMQWQADSKFRHRIQGISHDRTRKSQHKVAYTFDLDS